MKTPSLLCVLFALSIGLQAQTAPSPSEPPLQVMACSWTRTHRSAASAVDQVKKGKDAALDQQIALADRAVADGGAGVAESQALRERKQNQVELIPSPAGVVHGYLYQVQITNVANKSIKGLRWSYVFTDRLTQKEIVRHEFYSRTKIRPGERKKLAVFTRGAPPAVVRAGDLNKNSGKSGNESVVINEVEYADATVWQPAAKVDQVKPAND